MNQRSPLFYAIAVVVVVVVVVVAVVVVGCVGSLVVLPLQHMCARLEPVLGVADVVSACVSAAVAAVSVVHDEIVHCCYCLCCCPMLQIGLSA